VNDAAPGGQRLRGRLRLLLVFGVLLMIGLVVVLVASRGTSCDDSATASLTVYVTDASGSRVCDAEVTATDGSEVFTLEPFDCSYGGPWERSGIFVVHVSHDGRTAASDAVEIRSGECHVKGKRVDLIVSA